MVEYLCGTCGWVIFILLGPAGGTQRDTRLSAVWIDVPIDSEGEQGKSGSVSSRPEKSQN